MTDKELLELAAKAAGVNGVYRGDTVHVAGMYQYPNDKFWNPLTDDGDALRLAVKLQIDVSLYKGGVETVWIDEDLSEAHETFEACDEKHEGWQAKHAATRRAIVRAAAEIGKAMK